MRESDLPVGAGESASSQTGSQLCLQNGQTDLSSSPVNFYDRTFMVDKQKGHGDAHITSVDLT